MVAPGITVDGSTKIMGVIGDPIAQVMTPTTINPIFAARKVNIVCVPLHISVHELDTAWKGLKALGNLIGFGITLPHKQAAMTLCDSLEPLAERVGAVNLVRREADGSFRGYQFDGKGFVRGLKGQGHTPSESHCLMLGAGGAAIAIAFALAEEGAASLTIANRTHAKAEELAEAVNRKMGRSFARAGDPRPEPGQIVINATSLGLSASDPLPFDTDLVDGTMLIAEVIAKPEVTPFLEAARARGAQIHSGIHMIRGQVDLIAAHMAEAQAKV
ncbi:shikimate dehydrogenase [Nitratireductor aquibiodomus RA22]|uniref:shikimate dehydrogenase (NADP(+)) n=1 Tax=Nitratireductor aquibiodomus RA22 TaxID=1189611 RepID=I5C698_9HYPH|nr:shikimate dehydrogenase [Nitratireductor aquibiodomus]EIM77350.1 shikimate dehydrogenase [Nitratireductor aquibiodomus RA22]